MNNALLLRSLATIALAIMLTVNALANLLPINGLTTGMVSDLYPNLFTPAGFTFSIWSVIYALLIGFVGLSWIKRRDEEVSGILRWFILSCILNVAWILAWHFLLPLLSVLIMLMLLMTLSRMFVVTQRLPAGKDKAAFLLQTPFNIYFAWICVATIANIAAYLTSIQWDGLWLSPELWTVVMLVAACGLALLIYIRYRAPAVIAVILWTLAGIYFRWRGSEYDYVLNAITILAVILVGAVLYYEKRRVLA